VSLRPRIVPLRSSWSIFEDLQGRAGVEHGERGVPRHADTVVVGGGVGGAIVAARLAAASDESVLLLEAGPDYGPRGSGRWPAELLDFTAMAVASHPWHYTSAAAAGTPGQTIERARVIGGFSYHKVCAAVWGWRGDYDAWAAAGSPGWDGASLLPLFERANEMFRVFQPARHEITPWHQACLDAAPSAGYPFIPDLNSLDVDVGIAIGPLNVADGMRWNSAFAYLDPVRHQPNLYIVGDALVDRVLLSNGRATAVEAVIDGDLVRIEAGRVVLSGGAYGSPLVLLRSGIGPADEISDHGIEPLHELPGVGRNLRDHPATRVVFAGTPGLVEAMDAFVDAGGDAREEGTIVLARSFRCTAGFDLHLYPLGSRMDDGSWRFAIYVGLMEVKSSGTIRLSGRDPEALPIIDTGYFTDPDGADLAVLVDGIRLARELAAQEPLATIAGPEIEPCVGPTDLPELTRFRSLHDYHPTSSCKMGPAGDPEAVVDSNGKVHGLEELFVADASIMPFVPRANTNFPTAVVGEKIAEALLNDA
jgi:choline dehydrogenase